MDKAEVCRGEENFVDVDVYDPGGNDADLRITLSGTGFMGMGSTGIRMPFRLVAPLRAEEMPIVIVSGFGGTQAEQRIPFVKVNECASHSIVEIKLHKLPEVGPFAFELEAIAVPQDPLSEVSWDFGDGQHAVSQGSNIKHNYGNRPQHSRFSDFLISVSGRRSSGDLVEGSRTFELFNRDYWDRRVARQ